MRVALDYLGRRDPEHWRRQDEEEVVYDLGPVLERLAQMIASGELARHNVTRPQLPEAADKGGARGEPRNIWRTF